MTYTIGLIEDDTNIQKIVQAYLEKEGYTVYVTDNAEDGLIIWQEESPHMWIIDIMLPGMDGFEFCKAIRNESDVPMIMISAKDEEIDKILGLELGSDDYLTKPFSPRELVARVKRLFKRTYRDSMSEETRAETSIQLGSLRIDTETRRVFWDDEEVEITTKEFDLLALFTREKGIAFSRQELLDAVWGTSYFGSDRAVDDLVKRLRQKLPQLPLETVWGYGYRLTEIEDDK